MPLYDYKCQQCGHEFELLVMSGDTLRCPQCHADTLEKLMSGFSVRGGSRNSGGGDSGGSKCSGCAGGSCSSCH